MNDSEQIEIFIGQLSATDNVEQNLLKIKNLLRQIEIQKTPAIFCLPENCLWIRVVPDSQILSLDLEHDAFRELAEIAIKKNIAIHLGSVALREKGQTWNSSVWISELGKIQGTYKKIHLFNIQLEGKKPIRESDIFAAGSAPSILHFQGWKIGESICYDIRFSELYSHYAKQKVDVIFVPAAFLAETGKHHWQVLLRARAIESQCYIVASAQVGFHRSQSSTLAHQRESYGRSLVISPWGEILNEGSADQEQLLNFTLRKSEIMRVRQQIPMSDHRKLT